MGLHACFCMGLNSGSIACFMHAFYPLLPEWAGMPLLICFGLCLVYGLACLFSFALTLTHLVHEPECLLCIVLLIQLHSSCHAVVGFIRFNSLGLGIT